ncbi:hypothetical protein BZG36_04904 [Bifiguratus adelaidae]|uniref:SH3 domain-containing protein n=1 Tax=Bifiguratus adelaidae TaxID=1938954 RepID=A0A261XY50_9FUNG|nr:hypothetical protein BZG36_04904 [Bifiguratus adelaidae]
MVGLGKNSLQEDIQKALDILAAFTGKSNFERLGIGELVMTTLVDRPKESQGCECIDSKVYSSESSWNRISAYLQGRFCGVWQDWNGNYHRTVAWSAPSAIATTAIGLGHQAGGQMIESIIIMNYRAAVKAFLDGGQLQLGVNASLAVGPYGRAGEVAASASNVRHIAATYAYSLSKGLYLGYSFEGTRISERHTTNNNFYGTTASARDILSGQIAKPWQAQPLYDALARLGASVPITDVASDNSSLSSGPEPPDYPSGDIATGAAATGSTTANGYPQDVKRKPTFMDNKPSRFQPAGGVGKIDVTQPYTPYTSSKPGTVASPTSYTAPTTTKGPRTSMSYRQPPPPPPYSAARKPTSYVVALYDFDGVEAGDLSFKTGDRIAVVERTEDENGWWKGKIGAREGQFPGNYVQLE